MIINRHRINQHDYQKLKHSGVIITCQNKILLVQGRKSGKWSIPKGHSKQDENPLACAIREVFEETGISLYSYNFNREAVKLRVAYYFFAELPFEYNIEPKDTDEIISFGWFTYNDLKQNSMVLNVDANRIYGFLKTLYHPPHTDAPPFSDSITTL